MSNDLIESIIDNNLISAKEIFESRMSEILERKLYENKRMMQVHLHEGTGGLTQSDIEARKQAGYRPAKEVLGPTDKQTKSPAAQRLAAQTKSRPKRKSDETDIGTKLQTLGKQWKKASFGEKKQAVRMVQQAAKKFAAGQQTNYQAPGSKSAMDMSKMKRPVEKKPAMDMASLSAAGKSVNSILGRKGSLQKTVGKAPHDERVARATEYKAKRKTERVMNILGKGLRAVKRGAEEIGRTGGSI